jgi:hypothetical protein
VIYGSFLHEKLFPSFFSENFAEKFAENLHPFENFDAQYICIEFHTSTFHEK